MKIHVEVPPCHAAIFEYVDDAPLKIISGDITESMIANALKNVTPDESLRIVNTIDAPGLNVLLTLHQVCGWNIHWPGWDDEDEDLISRIKIATPFGETALVEYGNYAPLKIISGDITEDMIAKAIATAKTNCHMGFVNTLDAPAGAVLRTLYFYADWFVDWPVVEGGDEDDDDDDDDLGIHIDPAVY